MPVPPCVTITVAIFESMLLSRRFQPSAQCSSRYDTTCLPSFHTEPLDLICVPYSTVPRNLWFVSASPSTAQLRATQFFGSCRLRSQSVSFVLCIFSNVTRYVKGQISPGVLLIAVGPRVRSPSCGTTKALWNAGINGAFCLCVVVTCEVWIKSISCSSRTWRLQV